MPTIIKPKIISNIVQQQIVPNKPKILANEQIYVYVPRASTESPGIASFNDKDFLSFDGHISLSWPMKTQIEQISNPLNEISRVKLLSDEFEQTGNESEITNPLTEIKYISDTAEVKLKRTNRNAFLRPELIMLDNSSDFEKSTTPEGYSKYTLKRNNPLVQPALVKLDNEDFNRKEDETVDIRWPYAHNVSGTNRTDGYGLIKINPTSKLFFTGSNLLDVDLSSKLNKDFTTLDEKTTVSLTDIIPIQTDNKTYRTNLAALKEGIVQDLVKLKFEIVDELPNTGETNIIYLLPEYTTKIEVLTYEDLPTIGEEEIRYLVLDTNKYYIWNNKYVEYTNIYKEYIWLDELNKYEQLGTSDIELYANKVAYDKGISNLLALNVQDAIDELADIKVDKVEGSSLITSDELSKLSGIDTGAQVNTIEVIKVDNTPLTINEDKEVNIDLSGKVDKTIMGDKRRVYGVDASNNQELIEFDIIPTENSNNLVTSGSIYTGLSTKEPLLAETPEEPEDMFLGLDGTGNKIWKKVTSAEISPNGIDYLKDPAKTYVVIKTPADNDTFTLLTGSSGSPNYTIEWGDGSSDNIATTDNPTHEYEKAGMYLITISGSFPNGIAYGQSANVNKNKIIEVYGGRNYTLFIRDSAFYGCTSLTTANFPNATSISGTYNFYNCTNLTTIHLPRVTSIEYSAFYGCTSLTTANFPNATSIGEQVFKDCTNLTTANFPNATDIRNNAFRSCTSLTTANFPNATSIGNYAFYGCTSLKELTIGNVTATNTGTAFENVKLTNLKIAQDVTDTDIDRITTFYADNGGMFIGNETKHGLQVEKTPSADLDVVRKVDLDTHTSNTSNPHTVTKSQVGLSNAEDTADLDKPISTATQTALDLKATKLNIAQDQVPRKIGTGSGEPNAGISYTASATANTLMVRDANGQTRIVAGTENTHVVNKSQLDAVQGAIPANSDFTLTGLGEKSYNNLTDRPTIPTNSSFTLAGLSEKSYNSLTDKPTIPVAPTIVQDTGTSATSIMSQKAVTDKLAIKDDQPYSQHSTGAGNGYRLVAKFDYSASPTGDTRKVFRFKVKQGHGNGTSYVFWGDYIVGLGTLNQITCSGLLSKSDGTFGKCGYRLDAAKHTIYFYIYTGQYSAYFTSDITSLTRGTTGTVTWYTENGLTADTVVEGVNTFYPTSSGTLVTDEDLNEKLDKTTSGSKRRVYGVNASNNQEMIEFDTTPTESSTKLITSSGVYTAIQTAIYDSWGGEY